MIVPKKLPADPMQRAKAIVDLATGTVPPPEPEPPKKTAKRTPKKKRNR